MQQTLAYGSWPSPISVDSLVEATVGLRNPDTAGTTTYWVESRPNEEGRYVIVQKKDDGVVRDVIPVGFSARTLVHEYGGLSYAATNDAVFFSNFADQRLYRVAEGSPPRPITPEPDSPRASRYGYPIVSGKCLICVREQHLDDDVVNDLVSIATDDESGPVVLVSGHDFYTCPAVSPDGARLAWISWDHPSMPWDGTELYEADLINGEVKNQRLVAGGPDESVTQARFSPDGVLHFISDRSGWWNLYSDGPNGVEALYPKDCEFAGPDWELGASSYCFLHDASLVFTWAEEGRVHLAVLNNHEAREVVIPFSSVSYLTASRDGVVALVGSPTHPQAVCKVQVPSGTVEILRNSRETTVDSRYISVGLPIEYPTEDGLSAHALFYEPINPEAVAPPGEKPPLVVMSHGGPTGAVSSVLDYDILFWTSRGFAVVNVDYGGSTGYGRAYRERLKGKWGITDLDDCVNAAIYLADSNRVDGERMVIRGGSAGGYTTLCALTFRHLFAAGASYYGVADAGALARDTHKFESHYLDSLIGPWPDARETYEQRSPLFHVDELETPTILFQGLDDMVVPAAQSDAMASALESRGIPYAYLTFAGEQHGFRKAENIKRAAEAELYFYRRVLNVQTVDDIGAVTIHNEAALSPIQAI